MKFRKIVCLDYCGKELKDEYWKEIDKLCTARILCTGKKVKSHSDADCLLVKLGAKVEKEFVDKFPILKYIGMLGTGIGGIDLAYCKKEKITVKNITNYATESVSEFVFGMIIEHLRSIALAKKMGEKGDFSGRSFSATEIKDKTFGVIGLGNIGARIAEIAKGFDANVCYWSRNRKAKYERKGIKYYGLDKVLASSDILSVNLELNPQTQEFFKRERINSIKRGAIVVNVSPMELFNVQALAKRLEKGDITFMFDHADEMTDEEVGLLKQYKNCIMYPPIGYITDEATDLKQGIFVENIRRYLKCAVK